MYIVFHWYSRCTFVYGTPTMYIDMLGQPDFDKYDLSSVEAGLMGGSPCPQEVMKKLRRDMNVKEMMVSFPPSWKEPRQGNLHVKCLHCFPAFWPQIAYGTTENSPGTFLGFPTDNEELKMNTVGCILNHTEVNCPCHPLPCLPTMTASSCTGLCSHTQLCMCVCVCGYVRMCVCCPGQSGGAL